VAVIIDTPKGASYYGAAVSAPVFAEVAQQVLEYLGVPHDVDIKQLKEPAKPQKPVHEDDEDNAQDINALFASVNDLPEDDPLRQPAALSDSAPAPVAGNTDATSSPMPFPTQIAAIDPNAPPPAPVTSLLPPPEPTRAVIMTADGQRKVPELIGMPVRKVIETAAMA